MARFSVYKKETNGSRTLLAFFRPTAANYKKKLIGFDELSLTVPRTYVDFVTGETWSVEIFLQEKRFIKVVDDDNNVLWFRIEKRNDDFETVVKLDCYSLEIQITDKLLNKAPGGVEFFGQLPSDIGSAILAGRRPMSVKNRSFGVIATTIDTNADGVADKDFPVSWMPDSQAYWSTYISGAKRYLQGAINSNIYKVTSDKFRVQPYYAYKLTLTGYRQTGDTGLATAKLRFMDEVGNYLTAADRQTASVPVGTSSASIDTTAEVPYNAAWAFIEVIQDHNTVAPMFESVKVEEIGEDTGYIYVAVVDGSGSSVDKRDANVYSNSGDIIYAPGVTRFGTVPAGYWDGLDDATPLAKCSTVGSRITYMTFANQVVLYFKGSAVANSHAQIYVDDILVIELIALNNDANYTISGLDPHTHHIIEIEVTAGTVHFWKFDVGQGNLLHMRYERPNRLSALNSIRDLGGEFEFDNELLQVKHYLQRGTDRTVNGEIDFRRGRNIKVFELENDVLNIVNRVTLECYGDGDYQLVATVDADSKNEDSYTSQELYGVVEGTFQEKDIYIPAMAYKKCKLLANENCFGLEAYNISVYDITGYGAFDVGDWARFYYKTVNKKLRIIEIEKDFLVPQKVNLTVSTKTTDITDSMANMEKDLRTVGSAAAGAPMVDNISFRDDFDYTNPGEWPFYVEEGASVRTMKLRYRVTGMIATAKDIASGGANTPTSGASSSSTSGASSKTVTTETGLETSFVEVPHTHPYATRIAGSYIPTNSEFNLWRDTNNKHFQTHGGDAVTVGGTLNTYEDVAAHSHNMPHTHNIDHTHQNPHTHQVSIPDHGHTLQHGIYKSAMPSAVDIYLDGVLVASALAINDLDILPYIKRNNAGRVLEGWHSLTFKVAGANDTATIKGTLYMSLFTYNALS